MCSLTRSCFLLLLLGRFCLLALSYLLGTCLPSLWSPPFSYPAHAPISFSLAKLHLSLTLFPSHLTFWRSGLIALFLFLLAKATLASSPTANFVALRLPFSSRQAQYVQVFPLKPAPFYKLFAIVDSTNKSAVSLLFSSLTLALSYFPSFLLSQSLWQIWKKLFSLSSCSIRL